MKRRWLGLLVVALIGMFSNLLAARTLTIMAPTGTVHAGPGQSHKIVGKVANMQQYEVLEERESWYRIQWKKGKEGWVSADVVALEEELRGMHTAAAAAAPQSRSKQRRIALVIGNATYPDTPLRNAANDANDMAALLRKLSFEVTLILNANRRTMDEAIQKFTTGVPPGSVGLFYFSGHGIQLAGENYLIPLGLQAGANLQRTDVEYGAVKANWVLGRMDDSEMGIKLLILDACRNNPLGRSWTRGGAGQGLAFMDAGTGALVAYATSPGMTASDGSGRNSPYTEHLLQQIPTPGLPVEAMFKRVRVGVEQATKGAQIPWEHSSLRSEFSFYGPVTVEPVLKEELRQLGWLEIQGRVSGVEVWVGSEKIGETRSNSALRWENLPPGSYRVQGRKTGYDPWEREVTVVANQRTEVMIDMKPPRATLKEETQQLGGLAIRGRVPGAEVWVNTDRIGETKEGRDLSWMNLKPGSYRVKARKDGYEAWEKTIMVEANRSTEVILDMKPLPAPSQEVNPEALKPPADLRQVGKGRVIVAPTP